MKPKTMLPVSARGNIKLQLFVYILHICIPSYRVTSMSSRMAAYDIYSTLPYSMRREVLVRSKVETDYDTILKRKALVQSKSPGELSQISNLSEIPLPRKIEDWLHHSK